MQQPEKKVVTRGSDSLARDQVECSSCRRCDIPVFLRDFVVEYHALLYCSNHEGEMMCCVKVEFQSGAACVVRWVNVTTGGIGSVTYVILGIVAVS